MPDKKNESKQKLVKQVYPGRPDWDYYLLEPGRDAMDELIKLPVLDPTCDKACTTIISLLPRTNVPPHSGIGYQMINVDGYRMINAYVISDRLNSTTQRGFTLALSFSLNPFVAGVGVVGETSFFFNFDAYFEPGTLSHRTAQCDTSDLTTIGGLPWIGGVDLTHILRTPVMGPYISTSVFNEDGSARSVEVRAYLST